MLRRTLPWQLIWSFCLIVLAALSLVTWFSLHTIRSFYLDQTADSLMQSARLLSLKLESLSTAEDADDVREIIDRISDTTDTRYTIIDDSGTVIADTDEKYAFMEPHGNRPEIMDARRTGKGLATRYSSTLQQNMMYAATSSDGPGGEKRVVRASVSLAFIDQTLNAVLGRVAVAGVLVAFVAIIISVWLARHISRPIQSMTHAARRFARGEFTEKVPVPPAPELAQLSEAMNAMASELNSRLETIEQQTREKEVIFGSMIEGVLAIDAEGGLISMNNAAAELLGIEESVSGGRKILELIRSTVLAAFVKRAMDSQDTITDELTLPTVPETHIQMHGSRLHGEDGQNLGVLIVLHDITHMRKLEQIRKEFVANVSHELKTPVTSIKGFVETLLDDDRPDEETTRRFLEIISRQVRRLSTIIEDLLSLSRIERQQDEPLRMESTYIPGLIASAVELCEEGAKAKGITILHDVKVPDTFMLNGALFEQALVNLVDNAVKYSPDGSEVRIRAFEEAGGLVVEVSDNGIGIDPEHLPRLFERFYRVDKGRSRQVGGTGLGLAIVKHIVLSHGGTVDVDSQTGKGTTFRIFLPPRNNGR